MEYRIHLSYLPGSPAGESGRIEVGNITIDEDQVDAVLDDMLARVPDLGPVAGIEHTEPHGPALTLTVALDAADPVEAMSMAKEAIDPALNILQWDVVLVHGEVELVDELVRAHG